MAFSSVWALVWLVLWRVAPNWFVDSRSGLQTALQVLPAVIVSVLVLVLGSLFVVSQSASAAFGSQATLALMREPHVQALVVAPLVLAIAATLLSGQVPDAGRPHPAVAAAVGVVALATCWRLIRSAAGLARLIQQFGDPRRYAFTAGRQLRYDLVRRSPHLVANDFGVIADMLRTCVITRDVRGLAEALTALRVCATHVIKVSRTDPDFRSPDEEGIDPHWIGLSLAQTLAGAYEPAIRPEAPLGAFITITMFANDLSRELLRGGLEEETRMVVIYGLANVGTRPELRQATPGGNRGQAIGAALARIEQEAEELRLKDVAALVLAAWALVNASATWNAADQSAKPPGLIPLGPEPPWTEADAILQSDGWTRQYGELFDWDLEPARTLLRQAAKQQTDENS